MQLVAGNYAAVDNTLTQDAFVMYGDTASNRPLGFPYKIYSSVMLQQNASPSFDAAYQSEFEKRFNGFNEDGKSWAQSYFEIDLSFLKAAFEKVHGAE